MLGCVGSLSRRSIAPPSVRACNVIGSAAKPHKTFLTSIPLKEIIIATPQSNLAQARSTIASALAYLIDGTSVVYPATIVPEVLEAIDHLSFEFGNPTVAGVVRNVVSQCYQPVAASSPIITRMQLALDPRTLREMLVFRAKLSSVGVF